MMADTIRLLLLPRTRLFRAASLAGDDRVSPLGARLCLMLWVCSVHGFLLEFLYTVSNSAISLQFARSREDASGKERVWSAVCVGF
jgi:hypothetical protein